MVNIIIKLLKNKDKEKFLKAARGVKNSNYSVFLITNHRGQKAVVHYFSSVDRKELSIQKFIAQQYISYIWQKLSFSHEREIKIFSK